MEEQITQEEAEESKPSTHRNKLWIALGLFIIIIAAIGSYALFTNYNTLLDKNTALQTNVDSTQNEIYTLKKQTARELQKQQEELSRFQQSLTKLHSQAANQSQDWLIEEALYFMRMANYNLMLERNPPMATQLLKMADDALKQAGTADALALRQSINDDLATLATVPYVDTETLYIRLGNLAKQINKLPLKQPAAEDTQEASDNDDSWVSHLKESMKKLGNLVVIRRHDHFSSSQLQPEAINQLYQNMQLHLSSAQVALLQKQNEIYKQSLEQINTWITNYFDTTDANTQAVTKEIQSLAAIDINPHLPRIDVPDSAKAVSQ